MAKKSSGSAVGLLLLLAPFVWVCNLCTGDERRPPPAAAPKVEESEPAPVAVTPPPHEEPPAAAEEAEPEHHRKRRRKHRRTHHEEAKHAEAGKSVDPFEAKEGSSPSDMDQALKDALKPSGSKRHGTSSSSHAAVPTRTCCKHCGPTSKPCGNSCISLSKNCHKGRGCAC
ncbi:MAG: hypothetical protein AAF799_05690 [Myxococcota bacterium]